jgi:hypothetical protein
VFGRRFYIPTIAALIGLNDIAHSVLATAEGFAPHELHKVPTAVLWVERRLIGHHCNFTWTKKGFQCLVGHGVHDVIAWDRHKDAQFWAAWLRLGDTEATPVQ